MRVIKSLVAESLLLLKVNDILSEKGYLTSLAKLCAEWRHHAQPGD